MPSKKEKKRCGKRKSGSALVYALVMMTAVMIILVSMLGYISAQLKFSFNRVERERSFQTAEAGVYYYRWYLAHETSGKTAEELAAFWQEPGTLGVVSPYEADYEGIGKYKVEVTAPSSGSTIVIVKSTGWTYKSPEVKRTVEVRFRRPSWSEYIILSNDFLNFGSGSIVYGRVHSNTGIRFDGTAYNVISALVPSFNDPTHGGNDLDFGVHTHRVPADPEAPDYPWPDGAVPERPDVFLAGREFPVPEVSFSGITSDLSAMKDAAQNGGKYFDDTAPRRIILKTNGTFDVCAVNAYNSSSLNITSYKKTGGSGTCSSCDGACLSNYPIPGGGVIFVENNAWVEGTVDNKKITITAANLLGGNPSNIYIGMSNIRYTSYDGSDVIGIVAQRNITVIRDCPDDFIIDAALLAQTGVIGINQNVSSKNSITINGALASYLQPYFAHGVSGYGERTYNFDNNLLYYPPPYFPTGAEYSIDLWEEL